LCAAGGYYCEDIMLNIEQIKTAMLEAQRQSAIINGAEAGLHLQFIRYYECALELYEGAKIKIAYEDKDELAIYEGSRSTGYYTWVRIRFLTKKGKPYKTAARESCDIMEYITKV
jgi:hypothetical protein